MSIVKNLNWEFATPISSEEFEGEPVTGLIIGEPSYVDAILACQSCDRVYPKLLALKQAVASGGDFYEPLREVLYAFEERTE